ncbi:hypothetical protein HYW32_01490 [Candidatus Berkelbacteria bacterium]|nr:hypothetical protein [Candidatus Berkelbacteria bacterium]
MSPLFYFAIIVYLCLLLTFVLYSVYAAHHLNEYGYSGDASQSMLRAYIGFASVVILLTFVGIIIGALTL